MEHFVVIVNGWKPLTIITKSSILDVLAVLPRSASASYRILTSCNVTNVLLVSRFLLLFHSPIALGIESGKYENLENIDDIALKIVQ